MYINYIKKGGAEGGIVSEGIAQVVDKRAIPSSFLPNHAVGSLPDFASLCRFPHVLSVFLTPNSSTEIFWDPPCLFVLAGGGGV